MGAEFWISLNLLICFIPSLHLINLYNFSPFSTILQMVPFTNIQYHSRSFGIFYNLQWFITIRYNCCPFVTIQYHENPSEPKSNNTVPVGIIWYNYASSYVIVWYHHSTPFTTIWQPSVPIGVRSFIPKLCPGTADEKSKGACYYFTWGWGEGIIN